MSQRPPVRLSTNGAASSLASMRKAQVPKVGKRYAAAVRVGSYQSTTRPGSCTTPALLRASSGDARFVLFVLRRSAPGLSLESGQSAWYSRMVGGGYPKFATTERAPLT